jgi:pimeloyl-ACP methyl ester carboxylesterase
LVSTKQDSTRSADEEAHLADWRGVGYLVDVTTERLTSPVEGIHRAIVARWLGMAGPRLEPARWLADGLTASMYRTIRLGGAAVGMAISSGAGLVGRYKTLRPVWETRNGRYVQSIFNGVWGDRFDEDGSPIGIELGVRDLDGSPVTINATALRRTFPEPKSRLVLMLHGFAETERTWRSGENSNLTRGLEADGFSVLRLRYNTGRAIAANGSDLADLLEKTRLAWPVPVSEISLVGHSMGGLVARSAVATALSSGHGWVNLARSLVAIAAPHFGSPIEKGVQIASRGLGLFKESQPLGAFLDQRSAGIKSLRHGIDGADEATGALKYFVVAGAVTTEANHPLGRLVGDLVVRVDSATGKSRRLEMESSDSLIVGGRNHADLVHDAEVITQIRIWLTPSS